MPLKPVIGEQPIEAAGDVLLADGDIEVVGVDLNDHLFRLQCFQRTGRAAEGDGHQPLRLHGQGVGDVYKRQP